jgi:SAM-dependent MidA family methyltransferase
MELSARLDAHLARHGPLTIAQFMHLCLYDPQGGYYAAHPRLGAEGDFITAPHVSQMFGELLGAWAADIWDQLGRPRAVRLVELGPGDASLITDVLRGAPAGLRAAARLALVERSAPLRAIQARALAAADPAWFAAIGEVPRDLPVILLANEFLDCLPIRQAVRAGSGWRERVVGRGEDGALALGLGAPVTPPGAPPEAPEGAIFEWSPAVAAAGAEGGGLIAEAGGVGLYIDYGAQGLGDTLQAVRGHARENPLASPGRADLTARVDFVTFLAAARDAGAAASGPTSQGAFLRRLGVEARAAALTAANPGATARIARQVERLIAPEQMGDLFQAVAVHSHGLAPAGFA